MTDGEALTQLHGYLHPTAVAAAPPQPDSFDDPSNPWTGDGLRLFLTHVSDYAERAGAIRAELGKRSIDAFVAHDSIKPTEEWKKVILYALRRAEHPPSSGVPVIEHDGILWLGRLRRR